MQSIWSRSPSLFQASRQLFCSRAACKRFQAGGGSRHPKGTALETRKALWPLSISGVSLHAPLRNLLRASSISQPPFLAISMSGMLSRLISVLFVSIPVIARTAAAARRLVNEFMIFRIRIQRLLFPYALAENFLGKLSFA